MNYKLIVVDMDGTLLNSNNQVSEKNRSVLEMAVKNGIEVAIATGRIYTSARGFAELLGIYTPIIACNGALIRNYSDLEVIYSNQIAHEDVVKVIEVCKSHDMYFHIYDADNMYVEEERYNFLVNNYWKDKKREGEKVNVIKIKDMLSYIKTTPIEVLKFVLIDLDPERLSNIRRDLEGIASIHVDKSWYNNLEVMNKGVSKGKAIERLGNILNIPKERIIAFGDNYNDLSMKDYVGAFVAMANGEELVRKGADYITNTNDEDGVAEGILKLVLKGD